MNFFDKYFVFSHSEKKGILLFLIIIFLLCFIYWLIPRFFVPEPIDYSQAISKLEQAKLEHHNSKKPEQFLFNPNTISKDSLMLLGFSSKQAWNLINFRNKVKPIRSKKDLKRLYAMTDSLFESIQSLVVLEKEQQEKRNSEFEMEKPKYQLFPFDPNTISMDSLKLLGLSNATAKTLVRFREKSNGFKSKSDVWKVYGLSDVKKEELEPYIFIQEQQGFEEKKQKILKKVDLNKATKDELMAAKGIGNVFSDRIIEYRERIGGFVSVNQLTEVYGIDEDWMLSHQLQFEADEESITKVNINKVSFKELLSHPYFSYSQTQLIINFRDQHGKFTSIEQIQENNLIKPKHYRKIAPYLLIQ